MVRENLGVLIVASTPIGNLADHSPRLVEALQSADLIVAEDTRNTGSLLRLLGVETSAEIRALHEHNEEDMVERVLRVAARSRVVLVSDAGMPAISDPGYVLVKAAHERGIPVTVIPGPSAVIAALAASGLPTDRFTMEGFIPKKGRRAFLEQLRVERRTMVFFESPHRLPDTLREMAEAWGENRLACVARELTKKFEQIRRAPLGELAKEFAEGVKGEVTLVVEGFRGLDVDLDQAISMVRDRIASGDKPSEAARAIASETGHPRRELYSAGIGQGA